MNKATDNLVQAYQCYVTETIPETFKETKSASLAWKLLQEMGDLLIGDTRQYHGDAFVTPKLQRASAVTHGVAVAANYINVLTAAPIIYFGFRSLGIFGLGLSAVLSVAALKISNKTAEAAAASANGNRSWSNTGLLTFLAMNALLTVISGIGAELLTNGSTLSQQLASQLIQQQSEKIQPDKTLYEAVEKECAELEKRLQELPGEHPDRDRTYVRAYGTWGERESGKDWKGTPEPQIPRCLLRDMKRSQAFALVQNQRDRWNNKLASRLEKGNDLQFVKEMLPFIYDKHFTEDGQIHSGTEAIALAYNSFFGRLVKGDFSNMGQLGFSLFMFLLSVVTSVGACLLMIAHVHRRDTQISHNEKVRSAILEHLHYLESQALPAENFHLNSLSVNSSQSANQLLGIQPSFVSTTVGSSSQSRGNSPHLGTTVSQPETHEQTNTSVPKPNNSDEHKRWPASD